ncbi:hypothetical protein tinsulaeT_33650 [Thalassotalea insulae]|uniref:Sugar transporter n=1 Tax=Thalassotalea insulae TaxID=2056778 RepID=A0ABQ6GVT6_9GAMM|nr:hypothetical protein [Thalassotalea insulae]GLX80025.1 hypothetical protein tinsulaeT_33650 [Thalassotalea insulae]
MSDPHQRHRPKWFLVLSILALIWNMLGLMAFISHVMMTPEMIAELPEAQQSLYQDTPIWATLAFALAVFSGTSGCIFLVLKKAFANVLFVASLIGILLQNYYTFFVIDSISALGLSSLIMPLLVLTIAIALILMTSKAEQKQWLQ